MLCYFIYQYCATVKNNRMLPFMVNEDFQKGLFWNISISLAYAVA